MKWAFICPLLHTHSRTRIINTDDMDTNTTIIRDEVIGKQVREWICPDRFHYRGIHCDKCLNPNIIKVESVNRVVQNMLKNVCDICGERWSSIISYEKVEDHREGHCKSYKNQCLKEKNQTQQRIKLYKANLKNKAYRLYLEDTQSNCTQCWKPWELILQTESKEDHVNKHLRKLVKKVDKKRKHLPGVPKTQRVSYLENNRMTLEEMVNKKTVGNDTRKTYNSFEKMPHKKQYKYLLKAKTLADNDKKIMKDSIVNDLSDTKPIFGVNPFKKHIEPSNLLLMLHDHINEPFNLHSHIVRVARAQAINHTLYAIDVPLNLQCDSSGSENYVCFKCREPFCIDFKSDYDPILDDSRVCSCTDKQSNVDEQLYFTLAAAFRICNWDKRDEYMQSTIHFQGDCKFIFVTNDKYSGFVLHNKCCDHSH